ncbi:MAG: phosphate ABC transporter permease subunit PstC [Gloeomargarita sp. SKYBB_i_bin120]|nr:phosphate ABC transporter permease subunit PstC [Gloeomargarita sp. SKYG98]MCS7291396.1 phosphate ABC transporter permease subunit PstC [Gloeomargarita sp. SKYB120]MDW8176956.1 phosphate ABC transporter permease subunit PstC [Gloeomargarita sp. SKYBB_i_bin120]
MTTALAGQPSRSPWKRRIDQLFIRLTQVFAVCAGVLLACMVLVMAWQSVPAFQRFGLSFIFRSAWNPVPGREDFGVFPMLYGTLVSSLLALLIAVPLGLGTAIFLSEDFIPPWSRLAISFLVELLAAIPSVVYGLWGIFVLIPLLQPVERWLHAHLGWIPLFGTEPVGLGMLPASLVLAMMVLPIFTAIAKDSLEALPPELRQASVALGATRWWTLFRVLMPAALPGIVGGAILALGRALGETMAVTMLIGNANQLNVSLLAPANTIASLLANQFPEARGIHVSALMYAALLLMLMTLLVNLLAEAIIARLKATYE